MVMDPPFDATNKRFELINASEITGPGERSIFTDLRVASMDQRWTIPLISPDTMHRPSGENMTHRTDSECPVYMFVPTCKPVSAFQILTLESAEPEAMRIPSGEHATDRTTPLWPVMTCRRDPV